MPMHKDHKGGKEMPMKGPTKGPMPMHKELHKDPPKKGGRGK